MSTRSLPTETLEQIFSSDLEQPELAILCRVSKRFNATIKPFLYRSITLQSIRQGDKFKKSKEEDVGLVKSVKVVRKENPWEIVDMWALGKSFKAMAEPEKSEREGGVVKRLLEGDIVDTAQFKSIFVHQVVEEPSVVWAKSFEVRPKVFANLTDLSIVSHRGGVNVFQYLFSRRYLPALERLALCDVMSSDPGGSYDTGTILSGRPIFHFSASSDSESLENIFACTEPNFFQSAELKLLVSPSYTFLKLYPSLLHLTVFSKKYGIEKRAKYSLVYQSTRANSNQELDSAFAQLERIANDFSDYSLKYLALPSVLEPNLTDHQSSILNDLHDLGVAIHFDGDLGSVIAPPSFFEFRKKEEEEEEASKSFEGSDKKHSMN